MDYPEIKAERKRRLRPYIDTWSTCPTTNGTDLEVWEELLREEKHGQAGAEKFPEGSAAGSKD